MTREEAIAELKDSIKGDGYQCHREVYDMAISALEAQMVKDEYVIEPLSEEELDEIAKRLRKLYAEKQDGDCISRQAAINIVKGIDSSFVKYIEDLPSVQPEVIRCRECKHWHTNCLPVADMHGCDIMSDYVPAHCYCYKAERRE